MYFSILFLMLLLNNIAFALPWMTGPLLAPNAKTIAPGHINFEPYLFYTLYPEQYRNFETTPYLTTGLTSFMDIETSIPYDISWDKGQHGNDIGDYSLGIGLQVLREVNHSWIPNLRLVIQEIFPTGKFDRLNPKKLGTDQTGLGSYQSLISFNFSKLTPLKDGRYLHTSFALAGVYTSTVKVNGFNVFGGNETTRGKVHPGNSYSIDLAFEYIVTEHWVPVFEALYTNSGPSNFSGSPGFTPGGSFNSVGSGGGKQTSLAPAIEYNFNANLGIIAGVWFSVTGPHAGQFTANTIAIDWRY